MKDGGKAKGAGPSSKPANRRGVAESRGWRDEAGLSPSRPGVSEADAASRPAGHSFSRLAGRSPVQRRQPLQLKKFESDEVAKAWLKTKLSANMPAEGEEYDYFSNELTGDATYGGADLLSNLNRLYGVFDEAKAEVELEAQSAGLVRRQVVTEEQKTHILRGEVKSGTITGGHCRSGCEANGFTVTQTADHGNGFYTGTLEHPDANSSKTSTFFPDGWSEEEIILAIEYATHDIPANPVFTIASTKGTGTRLFFNGDSYFPYFD